MSAQNLPATRVSLLLAVRDEAQIVPRCLASLLDQDYPPDLMELIVADGDSTDGTRALIESFAREAPFHLTIVANPKRTAAAGFNAALALSTGEVVIILGARALPSPSFVSASVATLLESGADAVGGVITAEAVGFAGETAAFALASRFGVGDASYRYGATAGDVDTVNYGAYRRQAFVDLGGFDEAMNNVEDDELNYRLRAAGKRLYLSPSIVCGYAARSGIRALALQYARYGYPKVRVLRRHPRQMRPRQFVPAAFVAVLILSILGARPLRLARMVFGTVAGAYLAAASVASLSIARHRGWRYFPLLPAAFAAMHLSYGAASLFGVARFLIIPSILGRKEPSSIPEIEPSSDAPKVES